MIGQQTVIAMRMRGRAPGLVWLNDVPWMPQCGEDEHGHPWVHVDRSENPVRLDLRFLKGLMVAVHTDNAERSEALEEACRMAGATIAQEAADGAVA